MGGDDRHQNDTLDFRNIRVFSAVGRGAKGVVFPAQNDDAVNEYFALKVICKALIQKKANTQTNEGAGECKRITFEQQVLRSFNHPLLPRLRGVLETEKVIGYAIDYCPGGNIHSLRKKQTEKMFSDESIRFYAVELVLALEYLHSLGIVYRDLKPENIMIQETGHIMLVDFDLSKKLNPKSPRLLSCNSSPSSDSMRRTDSIRRTDKDRRKRRFPRFYSWYCSSGTSSFDLESPPDFSPPRSESDSVEKSNSFVGTEEYVAPEVISGKGHSFGVDWWSLGIVLYEMLYGATPFKGENRKETFYRILTKQPELTGENTPLRDLIGKLLEKDPNCRIELEEIKGHDFFKGVKWDTVLELARPPYIPQYEIDDSVGLKEIEVESFVHDVFFGNKEEEQKNKEEKKKGGEENVENNKGVWVEKLSQNPKENEDFFIF